MIADREPSIFSVNVDSKNKSSKGNPFSFELDELSLDFDELDREEARSLSTQKADEAPVAHAVPPKTEPVVTGSSEPAIKTLSFPNKKKTNAQPTASSTQEPAIRKISKVAFSSKMKAHAPRAHLDSEPEAPAAAPMVEGATSLSEMKAKVAPKEPKKIPAAAIDQGNEWPEDFDWHDAPPDGHQVWSAVQRGLKASAAAASKTALRAGQAARDRAGQLAEDRAKSKAARAEQKALESLRPLTLDDEIAEGEAAEPTPRAAKAPRSSWLGKVAGPLSAAAAFALVYSASHSGLEIITDRYLTDGPRIPELGEVVELGASEEGTDEGFSGAETSLSSTKKASKSGTGSDDAEIHRKADTAKKAPPITGEPQVEVGEMPSDLNYPGKGVIEVVTSERELIYVNDVYVGRGPLRRVPATPGEHSVRVRSGGEEQSVSLELEHSKLVRTVFKTL